MIKKAVLKCLKPVLNYLKRRDDNNLGFLERRLKRRLIVAIYYIERSERYDQYERYLIAILLLIQLLLSPKATINRESIKLLLRLFKFLLRKLAEGLTNIMDQARYLETTIKYGC